MKILKERKHPRQQIIKFSTTAPGIPEPELASHFMPKWFNDMPAHHGSGSNIINTAKRCVPMLDVMAAGYIIPLWTDLKITYPEEENREVRFSWRFGSSVTSAENIVTMAGAPDPKVFFDIDGLNISTTVWKLNCPWIITTPPGYSCLYTIPFNHPLTNMHFISGIVDTDTYTNEVNFPFLWASNSWEGLISAGTPLMQVIPFRRDSFKAEIEYLQDDKVTLGVKNSIDTVYENAYRKKFWERKLWK